ncbi:hypothetical protein B4090_3985 [Bacillus licheniformis]|nr:hypothetical protein B4090_3985 [Bacillus licheniformis]TWJ96847.1 hypothetical protein CHCC20442_4103 [Bacillus licheniformis]TWK70937.1 hypothetical protein CHCC20339_4505 [Bacillus licheniformis]
MIIIFLKKLLCKTKIDVILVSALKRRLYKYNFKKTFKKSC